MKKSNSEATLIKKGFIDNYYCFKFSNTKDYLRVYKKLVQDQCSITRFDIDKNGDILHYTKEDFNEFLNRETLKLSKEISNDINSNLKCLNTDSEIAVTVTAYSEKNNSPSNTKVNSYENNYEKIKFYIPFKLSEFVNESSLLTKEFIAQNNLYFSKNLKFYNFNLILQPLKLFIDNTEHFVNVRANIYSTGNLILHYTIPIENIKFSHLHRLDNDLDYNTHIPSYVINKDNSYDYIGDFKLDKAVDLYNKYILDIIGIKVSASNFFNNYTLLDYSNAPDEFDNAKADLKRDLYWLANWPYGYLNEQEKNKYNDFIKNRFSISLYASLFTTTNSKTIVAYNSKKTNIDELDKLNETPKFKYNITFIYLAAAIELLMIKQTYYSEISSFRISKNTTLKQLTYNYRQLLDIKNEFFRLTFGGYGSVSRLIEYLESNLIDFLPQEKIESLLNNYKELITITESESNQKRDYAISLLAVLFPILFGLNAIELLTSSLDKYLNLQYSNHSINLVSESSLYSVEIWIIVVILSIFLIYKHNIFNIFQKFLSFVKHIFIRFTFPALKYYYRLLYWAKKKINNIRKKG